MSKDKQLTLKQSKFLDVYFVTGNATEAAMKAYDIKPDDRATARAIGSENLAKLNNIVRHMMEERGLTLPLLIDTVKGATAADKWNDFTGEREADHNARLKAVGIASKWLGLEQQSSVNVQVNNIIPILGGKTGVSGNDSDPQDIES